MMAVSDELDRERKHRMNVLLPKLINVSPTELMVYLQCLSDTQKELLTRKEENKGARIAASELFGIIWKREQWYEQLLLALRETGHSTLADELDAPERTQQDAGTKAGDRPDILGASGGKQTRGPIAQETRSSGHIQSVEPEASVTTEVLPPITDKTDASGNNLQHLLLSGDKVQPKKEGAAVPVSVPCQNRGDEVGATRTGPDLIKALLPGSEAPNPRKEGQPAIPEEYRQAAEYDETHVSNAQYDQLEDNSPVEGVIDFPRPQQMGNGGSQNRQKDKGPLLDQRLQDTPTYSRQGQGWYKGGQGLKATVPPSHPLNEALVPPSHQLMGASNKEKKEDKLRGAGAISSEAVNVGKDCSNKDLRRGTAGLEEDPAARHPGGPIGGGGEAKRRLAGREHREQVSYRVNGNGNIPQKLPRHLGVNMENDLSPEKQPDELNFNIPPSGNSNNEESGKQQNVCKSKEVMSLGETMSLSSKFHSLTSCDEDPRVLSALDTLHSSKFEISKSEGRTLDRGESRTGTKTDTKNIGAKDQVESIKDAETSSEDIGAMNNVESALGAETNSEHTGAVGHEPLPGADPEERAGEEVIPQSQQTLGYFPRLRRVMHSAADFWGESNLLSTF